MSWRYVDPGEAADELLAEVVEPYLDDLDRRARKQARGAATEIGLGLLLGLYSCRDEDDAERVRVRRLRAVSVLAVGAVLVSACSGTESSGGASGGCPTDRSRWSCPSPRGDRPTP